MKYLYSFIAIAILLPQLAWANRISEVEDYYSERASKFIQSRFPNQPFTVIALVSVDKSDSKKSQSENLPYFDVVDKEQDIWSKADVPLSTLISYVDKVSIKVDLETDMEANELNALHTQLFEFLKLSTSSDKIEINKIKPRPVVATPKEEGTNWSKLILGMIGVGLVGLFILMQWSVRSLIKGLSTPISEIGKSTQSMASQNLSSALTSNSPIAKNSSTGAFSGDSSYESRRLYKEVFEETKDLFERPNIDLMDFLEEQGSKNPIAMTALFAEMKKEKLKELFSFGVGDWWFTALATPPHVNGDSLEVLHKLHRLKIKSQLSSHTPLNEVETKDFALILNRLDENELATVLKPHSFQTSEPLLHLLPKNKSMRVCKKLFPGNWAQFIEPKTAKQKISSSTIKQVQQKSLEIKPLRNTQAIDTFFNESEIEKYLDHANTWDEKEFYSALSAESPIRSRRQPFYTFFELGPEKFNLVLQELAIPELALILPDCERVESHKLFEALTERQRFRLREVFAQQKREGVRLENKIATKEKIRTLVEAVQQKVKTESDIEEKAA
jgi:hypothetical protein